MKKVLFIAACLLTLVACNDGNKTADTAQTAQRDSLQRIIEQKDNEINDMMGLLNEVEEGFRQINEAEKRVSVAKDGEGASKAQRIRENMQFIQQRMAENRELIAKLRQQVKNGSVKSAELQKTIENLTKQLEEKELHQGGHTLPQGTETLLQVCKTADDAPVEQLQAGTRRAKTVRAAHHQPADILEHKQVSCGTSKITRL